MCTLSLLKKILAGVKLHFFIHCFGVVLWGRSSFPGEQGMSSKAVNTSQTRSESCSHVTANLGEEFPDKDVVLMCSEICSLSHFQLVRFTLLSLKA